MPTTIGKYTTFFIKDGLAMILGIDKILNNLFQTTPTTAALLDYLWILYHLSSEEDGRTLLSTYMSPSAMLHSLLLYVEAEYGIYQRLKHIYQVPLIERHTSAHHPESLSIN
jgi:hypothetical protein